MKTKDLIKHLQELDPTGECQVFTGDGDIHTGIRLPWYYDGKPGILIRDENRKQEYNIIGMREINESDGDKVYLYSQSLSDLVQEARQLDDYKIEGSDEFKDGYMRCFNAWQEFLKEPVDKEPQ